MRPLILATCLVLMTAPAAADSFHSVGYLTHETPQWSLVQNSTDAVRTIAQDPGTESDRIVGDAFGLHNDEADMVAYHACWTAHYLPDAGDVDYDVAEACHPYYGPEESRDHDEFDAQRFVDEAAKDESTVRSFSVRALHAIGDGTPLQPATDMVASLIQCGQLSC